MFPDCFQLERALKFVEDSIINVDEVLVSMATGKFSVKLPAKRNKAMGKMSSGCYKFSFAYWHDETEAYRKSISNRNEDSKLIIISRTRRYMKKSARGDASDEDIEETQSVDERALICEVFHSPLSVITADFVFLNRILPYAL
jgi:hypothetical protein